jgi:UDP:flavonoid glycosyltransferase YjiC (YdhE family)
MQNILIGALRTAGEVLPFTGIGGELRKRAHDVRFISSPHFEPSAREVGLSFSPVGTLEYFQQLMTDSTVFPLDNGQRAVGNYRATLAALRGREQDHRVRPDFGDRPTVSIDVRLRCR